MIEQVQILSIGERANITIPSHLAWGELGFPGLVPPRSDLIFDIQLLEYKSKDQKHKWNGV